MSKRMLTREELNRARKLFREEEQRPTTQGFVIAIAVNTIDAMRAELMFLKHTPALEPRGATVDELMDWYRAQRNIGDKRIEELQADCVQSQAIFKKAREILGMADGVGLLDHLTEVVAGVPEKEVGGANDDRR